MRILWVESDAERTRCRMTQGSSVIAIKLIPGRGNEVCIKCIVDLSFQYYCTKCLSRLKETLQSPFPRRCSLICWLMPVHRQAKGYFLREGPQRLRLPQASGRRAAGRRLRGRPHIHREGALNHSFRRLNLKYEYFSLTKTLPSVCTSLTTMCSGSTSRERSTESRASRM